MTAVNHCKATRVGSNSNRTVGRCWRTGCFVTTFVIAGLLSTIAATEAGDGRESQRFIVSIRGAVEMQEASNSPDGLVRDIQIRPATDVSVRIASEDTTDASESETIPFVLVLREGRQAVIRLQSPTTRISSQPFADRSFVRYDVRYGETAVLTVSSL